ncbi:MAG TPA: hypothetical protein VHF69_12215 [Candidatus Synoicihabitans sp.]|nr:hypothetical protein [Candidatus Synoicihabitans sp.]
MNAQIRSRRAILAWFALTSLAFAQPRGDRDRAGGRVILYAEADFRGDAIVLYPGDRIENFADTRFDNGQAANDRVSSILIEGRLELVVYADGRLRGDALRLSESVSNLADLPGPSRRGNWNDTISSATVTAKDPRRPHWPGGTGRGPSARGPRVELYPDANYGGVPLVLAPGDRISNLGDVGFPDDAKSNDRISSIRVIGPISAVVHADADFRGASLPITESIPNLAFRSDHAGGRSWNDRISAVTVTEGRGGDGAAIVTRVYRDILGRDPEPNAVAHYSREIEARGWTESDLRNEVRRSREYRERDARAAVTRAYRDILKRDPDESGLATYIKFMVDEAWSESRVRDALRLSEEFRQRPR